MSPEEIGMYARNPVLYKDTYLRFSGLRGALESEKGIIGTLSTGQWMEGSTRIVVFGERFSFRPTSWCVGRWDVIGKELATGWDIYGWKILPFSVASKLDITIKAMFYFQRILFPTTSIERF